MLGWTVQRYKYIEMENETIKCKVNSIQIEDAIKETKQSKIPKANPYKS